MAAASRAESSIAAEDARSWMNPYPKSLGVANGWCSLKMSAPSDADRDDRFLFEMTDLDSCSHPGKDDDATPSGLSAPRRGILPESGESYPGAGDHDAHHGATSFRVPTTKRRIETATIIDPGGCPP